MKYYFYSVAAALCLLLVLNWFNAPKVDEPKPERLIALTFDDGPHPKYTPALLAVLYKHNVKATFFMVGENIEKHPDIAEAVHAAGHAIGNHSYQHISADNHTFQSFKISFEKTDALIKEIIGNRSPYYRAANFSISDDSKKYLCEKGHQSITANASGKDWATQNVIDIMERIDDAMKDINVILLHDSGQGDFGTRMGTVNATDRLITRYKAEGFRFVLLGEVPLDRFSKPDCSK